MMSAKGRKWVLIFHSLNLLSFGLPLFLMPALVFDMYGLTADEGAFFVARMMGAVALGNVVMSWLIRNSDFGLVQRPFFISMTVAWACTLFAGLTAMLGGTLNTMGWMFVFNPLLWVVLFGYLSLQPAHQSTAETGQLQSV
jgi:hypothetical protein